MPIIFLLCALSLSLWSITTDKLIAHAHDLNLSQTRYWHLLIHAPKEESEIDDDAFFLANNGKNDLASELDATIRHLNSDVNRSDESVFCRFPARRAWLEQELNVSFGEERCDAYATLVAKMDPQKVTLIFPTAHINSPASMFGHTFLRIDSSMESKLMSYAINYAAQTNETSGVAFAYKGLFGGYNGQYSMLPYYEKLKEYRDSESRDVWEYDLNLTHDEVMAMVRHIWELQGKSSQYFFFNENCSYHMLWLTEIARPSVHLRDRFVFLVNPPETVKAFEDEALVSSKSYRPSKRTKLLTYEKHLSSDAISSVKVLASGNTKNQKLLVNQHDDEQNRYILEAAAELVEYEFIEGKLTKELYAKRYHELLSQRAALGKGKSLAVEEKSNPDETHHAARITLGQGWYEKDSTTPLLMGYRPVYHDLSEDDTGHLSGAQIEFLDLLVGVDDDKVRLEKLTLLSLASITPASQFFQPLSWRMKMGWDREYGDEQSSFVMRLGAGSAIGGDKYFGYILSEPEIRLDSTLDAGLGFTVGGSINWGLRMKTFVESGLVFYASSDTLTKFTLSHNWQINSSVGLFAQMQVNHQEKSNNRGKVGINFYF